MQERSFVFRLFKSGDSVFNTVFSVELSPAAEKQICTEEPLLALDVALDYELTEPLSLSASVVGVSGSAGRRELLVYVPADLDAKRLETELYRGNCPVAGIARIRIERR